MLLWDPTVLFSIQEQVTLITGGTLLNKTFLLCSYTICIFVDAPLAACLLIQTINGGHGAAACSQAVVRPCSFGKWLVKTFSLPLVNFYPVAD